MKVAPGKIGSVFSIHAELSALAAQLHKEEIPYALCGALALALHGYPRATLDIDLLALMGSGDRIRECARSLGFTLDVAPMVFAGGQVKIRRYSKVIPEIEDVLMLDVLSLPHEIEREIIVTTVEWQGTSLRTVTRESLVRLKKLRGNTQDLADMKN